MFLSGCGHMPLRGLQGQIAFSGDSSLFSAVVEASRTEDRLKNRTAYIAYEGIKNYKWVAYGHGMTLTPSFSAH